MAKLLKLRRGTTSQHASFTGAEGEVTIDTTKDTAVIHDGSTAGGIPLAKESMDNVGSTAITNRLGTDSIVVDKIAAGTLPSDVKITDSNVSGNLTIVNADIAANAAIAGTKLENSGVTAGAYGSSSAIPIVTVDAQGLVTAASTTAIDSTTIANGTSNVAVANNGNISTTRSGTARFVVNDTGASVTGNLDVSAGVDVTGNITATGTVDGVDIAALNTTVGNLGVSGGVIASNTTATTQSQGNNSTKIATTAYTDTAVSNLVDSSPSALNTLNELAAAIGDDANFSTTITNSIATKMPKSGGEFTGNITCENITPDADSSRNLGTNSVRFANVYADTLYGSGANLTGIEAFVSGMILLWSGSTGSIPSGFVLCNGSNSTPDLRDRFVVGAGNSYSVGATGGATSRTVTISGSDTVNISGSDTVNISGSATVNITVSGNMPIIQRQYTGWGYRLRYNNGVGGGTTTDNNRFNDTVTTISLSGSDTFNFSGSDTVNISGSDTVNISGSQSVDVRPPYYALCYIMKT